MTKKFLPFSFLLLAAILIFTTSSSIEKRSDASLEVAAPLHHRPVLPDKPFKYDVFFPSHSQSHFVFFVDTAEINRAITPDGATLGRVLFYDKNLSFTNQLACASCHKQEFSFGDNQQFSTGMNGILTRNTMHLNDLVWGKAPRFIPNAPYNAGILSWDAREIFMEEMVLKQIEHADILGQDLDSMVQKLKLIEYYPPLFEKAYGVPEITIEKVGDVLSQFVYSMTSFDSKYDRFRMGQDFLTPLEAEGRQLMKDNCGISHCHGESNFCSAIPMNNGLDEVYLDEGVASHTGEASDIGKFKSPSLRNVELTAPYMHDGRFNTLEEVLDFYSEGVNAHENADFAYVGEPDGFTGFNFTEHEKEAIIAFLKTQTLTNILTEEKWSDPFKDHVSAEEVELSAAINVYPNPVAENFTIDLGELTNEPVPLKMFDHNGVLVWTNMIVGQSKQTFELQQFPKGIYLLQMEIGGVLASKKLLIR